MTHRTPFVALLLSLFTPGLGHLYAGEPKRAVLFFLINILYPLLFLTNLPFDFAGMVILLSGLIGIILYTLIDAYRMARKDQKVGWGTYNRWYYHVLEPSDPEPVLHECAEETLPNGRAIRVLKMPDMMGNWVTTVGKIVPKDCFFVVGDNRDRAADSRYIGMVSRDRLVGKVRFILYSPDWKRIGQRL